MKKGTFSVVKAGKNSTAHNSRLEIPNYLIDSSSKNYYELITPDQNFIIEAQEKYKLTVNQKMQKSQIENLILETCISIKPNHNVNDLKNLFLKLNEKYGGHELLELSIHRDEGHFLKDEIAYYPTKNILNKNGDWFICSNSEILRPKIEDFDKLVNINDFEKVLNLHAHAKFSMFDKSTGKSARMTKKTMSERIKFVSEFLELDYNPQKNRKVRKSVNLIKDEHLIKNRVFEKVQNMQNEINLKNDEIKKLKIELEKKQDLIYTKKLNKEGQRISFRTYAEYYRNELEKLKLNFDLIMNENQSLKTDFEALKKENENYKNLTKTNYDEAKNNLKEILKNQNVINQKLI